MNEATHALESDLWYCAMHFDEVMANREWLKEYAAKLREAKEVVKAS